MSEVVFEYRNTRGQEGCKSFPIDSKEFKLTTKEVTRIDLSPLTQMPDLEVVNLYFNHLPRIDLSPLAECPKLKALYLSQNRLRTIDLTPLSTCGALEVIRLDTNQLRNVDLMPLATCTALNKLHLENNPIEMIDISPVFYNVDIIIDQNTEVIADYLFKYARKPRTLSETVHRRMTFTSYKALFAQMGWKALRERITTFMRTAPRNEWFALQRALCEGFEIGGLGGYDGSIKKIADALPEHGNYEKVKEDLEFTMALLLEEQLDKGGPTTFLTAEGLKGTEAEHLIQRLEEVRKEEVENTVVFTKKGKAYTRPLWATGIGFEVLNKLGIGLDTDMEGLREARAWLKSVGIDLKVEEVEWVKQKYYKASPSLRRHVFDMVLEYAKRRKRK